MISRARIGLSYVESAVNRSDRKTMSSGTACADAVRTHFMNKLSLDKFTQAKSGYG